MCFLIAWPPPTPFWLTGPKTPGVVYITGSILFSNTQMIEEIGQQVNGFSSVIFSMRGVSYMDISGAQAFLDLLRQVQNRQARCSSAAYLLLCGK